MYLLLRMYVSMFFDVSRRSVSSWMPSQFEVVVYIVYGGGTLIYVVVYVCLFSYCCSW